MKLRHTGGNMSNKRIWITWESQRRSVELAKALNCDFYQLDYDGFLRYPRCIFETIIILLMSRHKVVFVQNPSMILAALVCFYKIIFKTKIIVDRHTTFRLNKKSVFNLEYFVFKILNPFTIKYANLTIVTNEYLAEIVRLMNGNPYVLPDKLPDLSPTEKVELSDKTNIMFIASYGEDEPIEAVIKAVTMVSDCQFTLYMTGNHNNLDSRIKNHAPPNVVFTGFLRDPDFVNLLFAVDAIMVLTTATHCMLCGCYEGVVAVKPIITSRKQVLQEYFKGSIFVDNTEQEIAEGLREMITNLDNYKSSAIELKTTVVKTWGQSFSKLEKILEALTQKAGPS